MAGTMQFSSAARRRTRRIRRLLLALLLLFTAALLFPTRPARTSVDTEIFQGVSYTRRYVTLPRPLMVHRVEVDLTAPGVRLVMTSGDASRGREYRAQTTGDFLSEFGVQVAINGSFFQPFRSNSPLDYYPTAGDPVNVLGIALADGEVHSEAEDYPFFCFAEGRAAILDAGEELPSTARLALAGDQVLVRDGKSLASGDSRNGLAPRTAIATDDGGQTLWLVVIDGRQEGYSEGVSRRELAQLLVGMEVDAAINLDGGGSSTLVRQGRWKPATLNAPFHTRIWMRQRPVANHLGVIARPLSPHKWQGKRHATAERPLKGGQHTEHAAAR